MLKVEGFLCVCVCRQRGECESHCLGFGGDEQQQQKKKIVVRHLPIALVCL